MDEKLNYILSLFPDARCELHYQNTFQLLIAVVLSAQTTDKSVNGITPSLFEAFPTIESLANAPLKDVEKILRHIGMYRVKSQNIIGIAKRIHEVYHDEVPSSIEDLFTLPGVGAKTINVVLAEGFKIPSFPVDTHVNRVAKRLKYAFIKDDVSVVERKMKKKIPEDLWIQMHHSIIFFGRYHCKAIAPLCEQCALKSSCRKNYK